MAREKIKELVKYDNDLNLVAFKNFSKVENDVFFALMWKLKEQSDKEIRLDFAELRELIDLRNMTNKEINIAITDIGRKISKSIIELETETEIQFFTIFQVLAVSKNTDDFYIRAKINKPFLYILNNFENGGFTMFELIEFSSLSSKYTQTLYRLLKQFRHTGKLWLEWNKFIEIMDIPTSYNMGTIDNQILKPAIKELSEITLFSVDRTIFKDLKYIKERARSKGRPIKAIEFTFMPELRKLPKIDHVESLAKATKKEILKEKINPITKAKISLQDEFIFRSISLQDKNTKEINILKITDIQTSGEQKIIVTFKNVDDEYINKMIFETKQNFVNFFEKYKI